ncbi:DUF4430 domain-containing protein [Sporosarcina sp. P20a]|uniref:DUF4430 domain-containing protein n=1 Tax=Sporosarcina sp. P20a TaxID=2048256 RepID=UPI0013042AE2|nr:DUF4430 domain-containing protein [Sporosarcina sp. P20a]
MGNVKTFYGKYRKFIYYSVILLLMFSSISYAAISDPREDPFDFNEIAEASTLKLAGGGSVASDSEPENDRKEQPADEQITPDEPDNENAEVDSKKQPVQDETPKKEKDVQIQQPTNNATNTNKPANSVSNNNETVPDTLTPTNRNDNSTGGSTQPLPDKPKPEPEKPAPEKDDVIEIVAVADKQNNYFTTNLTNNEVVTDPLYYVTVTHLDESLIAQEMTVLLNSKKVADFKGELTLAEGPNDVEFQVIYAKKNGEKIRVSQTFRVILNRKDIVIHTELKDRTVTEESLTFTAQAKLADTKAELTVLTSKEELKPVAGNVYKLQLQEGPNQIILTAKLKDKKAEQSYTVIYEKEKISITLDTDLQDRRANDPEFSFFAKASAHTVNVPLTILLNGQTVTSADGTNYSVQLKNGTNVINLTGQFEKERLERQYKILYKDPNVVETPEVDPKAPKLVTDLKSGITVKGDIKTINVWPVTANGDRIRGKNVLVKVNGGNVPFTWDDSAKTSYKLNLKEGENNVSIKVWDDEGRTVTESFKVHSKAPGDDGVIGQVTISVEASTIGIKYLIPPTKMDIHKGERGTYILDQVLRNHGFDYGNTGSLDSSFYLKEVMKPGMLNRIQIPEDLWSLVEASSSVANIDAYSPDSLGEFDFANGSGWMYSVNGDFPNYGFSDAYFLDGDVVRVRYTLHYGKDIGGHDSSGDSEANWNKEW